MPGFGQFGLLPTVRSGSKLNYNQDWVSDPLCCLPAILPLLVGESYTIYGDDFMNVPIKNYLHVTYTCELGSQSGNDFTITPTSSDVGDTVLSCLIKNGNLTVGTYTTTLRVYEKSVSGSKKVLMCGDSIMYNGMIWHYPYRIQNILNNNTITFLGTQGTTYKHEGRSGTTWSWWATQPESPYRKGGVIDIASYFTDNSIDIPDIIVFQLGVNDMFANCTVSGDGLTDAELDTIITNAKSLIDAFLEYNASIRICIQIPTTSENSGAGWNENYDETVYLQDAFLHIIKKYQKRLITEFADGIYNTRVYCGYSSLFIDRNDGYPKTDGVHNNGVHPDTAGLIQVALGHATAINKMIIDSHLEDGLTVGDYDYTKNLTKDVDNKVLVWGDKLGVNHLSRIAATYEALYTDEGLYFSHSQLEKAFTFNQPEFIFLVVKYPEWSDNQFFFDGKSAINSGSLRTVVASPKAYIRAGANLGSVDLTLNKYMIVRVLFNGVNSKVQINSDAALTGDAGALNMSGLSLGGQAGGGNRITAFFKRVILRSSETNEIDIYNLLRAEYSQKDF